MRRTEALHDPDTARDRAVIEREGLSSESPVRDEFLALVRSSTDAEALAIHKGVRLAMRALRSGLRQREVERLSGRAMHERFGTETPEHSA